MPEFFEDCLRIIFTELQYEPHSLYSCILVNRFWCQIVVPILWKNPFNILKSTSNYKLYSTIVYLLPTSSKQLLFDNDIELPLPILQNKPLFNYISFSSEIPSFNYMVRALIKDEVESDKFQEKYEILEQEVYKLFISNCKNTKRFYLATKQPLSQFPGASICFFQLCNLIIDIKHVTSTALFGMAQICQNIEDLKILYYNEDIPGLINFIDVQKNLKSLNLKIQTEKQHKNLSDVIERKAATLKKFTIRSNISFLLPKVLLSLINLEYLNLFHHNKDKESLEMQEWKEYLSIASFPNLQYLHTFYLPFCKEYSLVEKTNGNIIEITVAYNDGDIINTQRLIKAIAKNCPKLQRLKIYVEPKNLEDIKEIFLNCIHLETIELFKSKNEGQFICDRLLEILFNFSSKKLREVAFHRNWMFTIEGLRKFFENWRDRIPIEFYHYVDDSNYEYEKLFILEKYFNEGIIKKTNYFFRK